MESAPRIALLRGINLAGHNRVPMKELRDLAASLGLGEPETYIQSGNLLFDHDAPEADTVGLLESALLERFGFFVPVMLRTGDELAKVAAAHPLDSHTTDPRFLMVAFLDRVPDMEAPDVIEPDGYLPDRYQSAGRDIYLVYPRGSGRSKLDHSLLERRLRVRATVRNWKTVAALSAMVGRRETSG
jgi:uncharacterized protein (DUF1697 family)